MNRVAFMWPRGRTSAFTLAGAMGSNESALMVLKAFLRPQELYLGAVVGVVSGLLRMSAAAGLVGRGCPGTPSVFAYVLLLLINCGRDRRTEGSMLGSRARASVVGPLVTERRW